MGIYLFGLTLSIFVTYFCLCLPFQKCVELAEKERFPDSRPAREKPFRMYKNNRVISVKFTNLEDGWKFVNTDDSQVHCSLFSKTVISIKLDSEMAGTAILRIS